MRRIFLLFCMCNSLILLGQASEEEAVKATIDSFFTAFHAQDSLGMSSLVSQDVVLQTIGSNKEGKTILRTEKFNDLIRSIVSIPDSLNFLEKLLDYSIQIDGAMANVWTPYEFWLNHKFSHCGVNSFQLFKDADNWKIVYLIDTRRREGCQTDPINHPAPDNN